MAWVNADVGIENQSICNVDLAWENAGTNNSYWITNGKWNNGITGINCASLFTLGTPKWIFGDSQYGLYFDGTNNMPNIHTYYNGFQNDNETGGFRFDLNWGNPTKGLCCIFVGINEDTQKGTIKTFQSYYTDNRYSMNDTRTTGGLSWNSTKVYEIIKHSLIPTYTWQSVPSISGKNGILQSLVQIKEEALNDGEPVSEASVTSFDSLGNINIPSVIDEQMPVDPSDVTSVTATYLIPALEDGTYEGIKLLVKKNSIPTSEEDADKVIDLSEPTSILRIDSKSVGNLDEDSHYYFMVKLIDELGTEATSDPKDIWTSHSEGYNFDYTGEIVEWTVPKTGIYSLETWGAQGGDATDGTNSARGGYGAYAYGEVLLTQGEKLYINVGGQNGYGGGGFNSLEIDAFTQFKGTDVSTRVFCGISSGTMFDASNCAEATQSGELLSNKLLYAQGEGVTPTIDTQNKEVRYPANPDGNTRPYSVNLIPINRNTDAHYIKCTAVRTTNVSANYRTAYFELSVYYVENGELKVGTNTYIQNPTVDAEIEMSLDVSSLSYIDYIGFGSTKDAWTIKDIVIDMS